IAAHRGKARTVRAPVAGNVDVAAHGLGVDVGREGFRIDVAAHRVQPQLTGHSAHRDVGADAGRVDGARLGHLHDEIARYVLVTATSGSAHLDPDGIALALEDELLDVRAE